MIKKKTCIMDLQNIPTKEQNSIIFNIVEKLSPCSSFNYIKTTKTHSNNDSTKRKKKIMNYKSS